MISLITCDPGSELYMLFGHSAIRVNDGDRDLIYNYGTFDFNTPGFAIKFMRGKLPYMLTVNNYGRFLQEYHYDKRGVKEQKLLLDSIQKAEIIQFLNWNAKPENALYKYDFFFDNCSSRIRDIFNEISNDSLIISSEHEEITFRQMLHEYLNGYPWMKFGIDLIIGAKADQLADVMDQMFLPDYLMNNMGNASYNGEKLLSPVQSILIFDKEKTQRNQAKWYNPSLLFLILSVIWLLLTYQGKHKIIGKLTNLIFLVVGVISLIIIFLWFATDHISTKLNYNLIWLNPLAILCVFTREEKRKKITMGLLVLTLIGSLFTIIPLIPQAHPNYLFSIFLLTVYSCHFWITQTKKNEI